MRWLLFSWHEDVSAFAANVLQCPNDGSTKIVILIPMTTTGLDQIRRKTPRLAAGNFTLCGSEMVEEPGPRVKKATYLQHVWKSKRVLQWNNAQTPGLIPVNRNKHSYI